MKDSDNPKHCTQSLHCVQYLRTEVTSLIKPVFSLCSSEKGAHLIINNHHILTLHLELDMEWSSTSCQSLLYSVFTVVHY